MRYRLTSIILHGIVLLCFIVFYDEITPTKKYGNTNAQVISAFVSHDIVQKQSIHKNKSEIKKQKINTADKGLIVKNREQSAEIKAKQMARNQGESFSELLVLLHDAIQQKQEYPESALAMQREGGVTVSFKLYKDGHMTDLKLVKSSGTTSLDEAALNAVLNAAPFSDLIKYIKDTQEYKIDIVFKLT